MIYSRARRLLSARLSAAESENCSKMPNWQRAWDKVCCTCEKQQCGHVSPMTTALSSAFFSRNNGHPVSDALHKSNRLLVCLPTGGWERSEAAVSVPASCSSLLSVSLKPQLISAFQLRKKEEILLLHCPPHKEFWSFLLEISHFVSHLCAWVLTLWALLNLNPSCFSWKTYEKLIVLPKKGL